MAELEPGTNRTGNEPSSRDQKMSDKMRRKMPRVDFFEEMNFEQRRAPYNSGSRNIADRAYDKDRPDERSGRREDC